MQCSDSTPEDVRLAQLDEGQLSPHRVREVCLPQTLLQPPRGRMVPLTAECWAFPVGSGRGVGPWEGRHLTRSPSASTDLGQ